MKVFCVARDWDYGSYSPEKTFAKKEDAEKFRDVLIKTKDLSSGDVMIWELEVLDHLNIETLLKEKS